MIGGAVAIIDVETKKIIHKIAFDIPGAPAEAVQPVGIRLTSDGKLAFIALGPSNRIAAVDAQTHEILD